MGLFIGASILTLLELVDYLYEVREHNQHLWMLICFTWLGGFLLLSYIHTAAVTLGVNSLCRRYGLSLSVVLLCVLVRWSSSNCVAALLRSTAPLTREQCWVWTMWSVTSATSTRGSAADRRLNFLRSELFSQTAIVAVCQKRRCWRYLSG